MVFFFCLGIGYSCLLIWVVFLAKKVGVFNLMNVLLLVIFGLVYDNLIMAFATFIGEGNVLQLLSYIRYWLHALFTPTLILYAFAVSFRAGLPWAKKTYWKAFAYLLTSGLILYELLTSVKGLKLEPHWKNGVLSYESVGQSVTPVMVMVITLILVIVGFLFIVQYRFIWLFIGTLVMIVGGIIAAWTKSSLMMNGAEFLFIISLLFTYLFLIRD